MAHIYMTFDFGSDEDTAQQARHKLDVWKQAFRLDKKLLYKFERTGETHSAEAAADDASAHNDEHEAKPAKSSKSAKSAKPAAKSKTKPAAEAHDTKSEADGNVKLLLRLAFSSHEKLTEQRWLDRIPGEEPFRDASPETLKESDAKFAAVETRFESLE